MNLIRLWRVLTFFLQQKACRVAGFFVRYYLIEMVCLRSGPTETTVIGTLSSFSKKAM